MRSGLIPINPLRGDGVTSLFDMMTDLDRFFSHPLFNLNPLRTDIRETDNEYLVEAEIPGMEKQDIKVSVHDGVLAIRAERNTDVKEERNGYIRRERSVGTVERRFALAEDADEEHIEARYENGILRVIIPKAKRPGKAPREIQIH